MNYAITNNLYHYMKTVDKKAPITYEAALAINLILNGYEPDYVHKADVYVKCQYCPSMILRTSVRAKDARCRPCKLVFYKAQNLKRDNKRKTGLKPVSVGDGL